LLQQEPIRLNYSHFMPNPNKQYAAWLEKNKETLKVQWHSVSVSFVLNQWK